MMERSPKVGIGVMVIKDGKMLLGKRKNAHGEGTWSYPGGHLEFGESWEACSKREVMEETGIQIKNLRFGMVTNDVFEKEHKHYITIFIVADFDAKSRPLPAASPHKCPWFIIRITNSVCGCKIFFCMPSWVLSVVNSH